MYGVPEGETKIASTAGAGSLLIEFEVLSRLSGDESFGRAALLSMKSIYKRRSPVGLVGKHINTETGAWHESISGEQKWSIFKIVLPNPLADCLLRNRQQLGLVL